MHIRIGHGLTVIVLYVICVSSFVNCWESYELDLFDLVEEVGQNFYEFFGVSQGSDANEIKKAYRKLSLQYHPDRNSEADAETKFRHLVAIYEVLKDDIKRARYDQVLEHGIPDWKTPIYYFRRVRKLSLYELVITLSVIISIGHYFVMWAQHFEKKLTLDDRISDVRKLIEKKQKKKKASHELDELDAQLQNLYDTLPSPSLKQTLPCRLSLWLFRKICQLPFVIIESIKNRKSSNENDEIEEEQIDEPVNKNKKSNKSNNKLHLDLNPKTIEQSELTPVITYNLKKPDSDDTLTNSNGESNKNKEWSDKERSDLIKAIAKFPAGSINRWIRISEMTGRSPQECIQMEKLMKTNLSSNNFSNLNASILNNSKKVVNIKEEPTLASNVDTPNEITQSDQWTQEQQNLLEKALKDFNKDTPNRWDRIAETIPNKSKEDCINRYKALCATLKKK